MRKIYFILFLLIASRAIYAQNTLPHIYKNWTVLGETTLHGEVSYRTIKCTNNQIHLSINNKNSIVQTIVMDCKITNTINGLSFTKELICVVPGNNIIKAECTDYTNNNLKIDLSDYYDPNNITITILFRE
jgi:hypothetical protein